MLQWEHSAILLTFIKLPYVRNIFVLSIFEWPLKTGFTVVSLIGSWKCKISWLELEWSLHKECSGSINRPGGYNTFSMLNSAEHKIYPAH